MTTLETKRGRAATLLDSACACAVHSLLTTSQACTTLELKVAYHKPVTKDTGLLRAEGQLLSFSRLYSRIYG